MAPLHRLRIGLSRSTTASPIGGSTRSAGSSISTSARSGRARPRPRPTAGPPSRSTRTCSGPAPHPDCAGDHVRGGQHRPPAHDASRPIPVPRSAPRAPSRRSPPLPGRPATPAPRLPLRLVGGRSHLHRVPRPVDRRRTRPSRSAWPALPAHGAAQFQFTDGTVNPALPSRVRVAATVAPPSSTPLATGYPNPPRHVPSARRHEEPRSPPPAQSPAQQDPRCPPFSITCPT